MNNPWLNISWSDTIADCDKYHPIVIGSGKNKLTVPFGSKEYVDFINKKDVDKYGEQAKHPVSFTFDCLPDPFCGDPKSEVYCLNMNPGEPDLVFCKSNDKNGEYVKYAQDMLNIDKFIGIREPGLLYVTKDQNIIYDPDLYKNILNDICNDKNRINKLANEPIRPHGGAIWQRKMRKALIDKLGRDPKIFDIEYFPYHSKSGFTFPKDLPSYEYRNELIKKAMDDKKLIIIMRMRDEWYEIENDDEINGLGPRLKRYANKIFLKNSQRVWLTPGNFCWEIPETQNKTKSLGIPYAESWACHSVEDIINKF